MSDAGGLFVGSTLGKNRFAHSISPSKTWEGVSGALIFPVFVGFVFWCIGM